MSRNLMWNLLGVAIIGVFAIAVFLVLFGTLEQRAFAGAAFLSLLVFISKLIALEEERRQWEAGD